MGGILLFCLMSEPVMSPPRMISSLCQSLGHKQQQQDPGCYLATGSDGHDNEEKSYCIFKDNYFIRSSV